MKKIKNVGVVMMTTVLMMVSSSFSGPCPVDPRDHSVLIPVFGCCDLFYSCSNGVPILLCCPPGLWFNENLDVCDWPESTDCAGYSCGCGSGSGSDISCSSCCDPYCTDCMVEATIVRCMSKATCYNDRFTVKTCPRPRY